MTPENLLITMFVLVAGFLMFMVQSDLMWRRGRDTTWKEDAMAFFLWPFILGVLITKGLLKVTRKVNEW